jgi:hypothetical protein
MEGGGDGSASKAALRDGMNGFLGSVKQAASAKGWRWKLVACGGRDQTFRAFAHALKVQDMLIVVLLVDAEERVTKSPKGHLRDREPWKFPEVDDRCVHLMIQTMETWIVADVHSLANYYGKGFKPRALPRSTDLEAVPKDDMSRQLLIATRGSQKGEYHKIRHASDLLKVIDPKIVASRCPACARLFRDLAALISTA